MPRLKSLLMVLILIMTAPPVAAQDDTSGLTGQERLLIRALQWDSELSRFVPFDGVSGEYGLSASGHLLLPLIGPVEAVGKTPVTLAQDVSALLSQQLGLSPPPRIGVEVADHGPVYVLGDVSTPGAYPYRRGLTAQQALAMSGGLPRLTQFETEPDGQKLMRLGGEIRVYIGELGTLNAERQRLLVDLAALSGDDESPPPLPAGVQAELLAATQTARKSQGDRIGDLQTVLREQIDRLTAQIALRANQIVSTQEELDGVNALKERGLAANSRVSALTNKLNDLEATRLQLEIARLTARQQLNRAERDALSLVDDARAETLARLNTVNRDITRLEIRLATARALRSEALAAGMVVPDPVTPLRTLYHVTRVVGGSVQDIPLAPTAALRPGDTLHIRREEASPPATDPAPADTQPSVSQ